MSLSRSRRLVAVLSLVLAAGCRRGPRVEEAPALPVTTPSAAPAAVATPLGPPQAAEVQAKLDRVFGGVVRAVGTPDSFTSGDFNRDGLTDLAALADVNPGRLADVNNDLAAWIVQDAPLGPADPRKPVPPRPTLGAERVLVVINAFDAAGWRNPEARQAYVLKGVSTAPLGVAALSSVAPRTTIPLGPPTGDAVVAQAGARRGFVSFANGRYWWAPFEAEAKVAKARAAATPPPPAPPHGH